MSLFAGCALATFAQSDLNPRYATNFQSSIQNLKPPTPFQVQPEINGVSQKIRISQDALKPGINQQSTIIIDKLNLKGVNVYSQEIALNFFRPILGKVTSLEAFIQATEQLIQQYWKDGYILAEADINFEEFDHEQRIATIHIYEGGITRTSLQGGDLGTQKLLHHYMKLISQNEPLNTESFETYRSLINYLPNLSVSAQVRPIDYTLGEGSLTLTANQKKFMPYFVIDNRGSKLVGPYRGLIGAYTMSLLKEADLMNVSFITTPSKELQYGRMNYTFPLDYSGNSLNMRLEYGKIQPGFVQKQFNIVQHDFRFEALYQHAVFSIPGHQIVFKAGVNGIVTDVTIPNALILKDQVRELTVGFSNNFKDFSGGRNFTEFRVYQGIRALGAANQPLSLRSAPDGDPAATRLSGEWAHAHFFPNNFSLVLQSRGQFSFQPLLDSTAFYLGSYPYGSAYDPGEIGGDHGLAARLEGRYLFETNSSAVSKISPYIFYDGGKTWFRNVSSGYKGKSIVSGGIGVRTAIYKNYEASLELSKPLTLKLRSLYTYSTTRPWRLFFTLSGRF